MQRFLILLAAAVLGMSSAAVSVHDYTLGTLGIEHPYARATPPNAPVSGGYLTIRNGGTHADRLLSGEADFAERVEIHEMSMEGDVMKMRHLADGLEIPAGGEVVLEPGGHHIMFIGIDSQFREGETRKARLTFEKAGTIEIEFGVEDLRAMDGSRKTNHATMKHGG